MTNISNQDRVLLTPKDFNIIDYSQTEFTQEFQVSMTRDYDFRLNIPSFSRGINRPIVGDIIIKYMDKLKKLGYLSTTTLYIDYCNKRIN